MNIYNVNKRQFEATMKKEKVTVRDYYDNDKSYDVFFRRNNRSNTPQGKVRFYYAQDTEINVGTVFVMKGTTYLVISRDADESDIYYTSLAVKCDTSFTVYSNAQKRYVIVPFVATSDKYTISHNSTISIISGSVVVYTGLNAYVREMKINDLHYNFGGYYKIGNYFYNDNIAYIYLEREADRQDTYSLIYDGATSLELSDDTYQLSYTALKNGIAVQNPSIVYLTDHEDVGVVSDSGLLTLLSDGIVTVTAVWTDGEEVSCSTSITVKGEEVVPIEKGSISIIGSTNLNIGYTRTYTAVFKDSSGNQVSGQIPVWTLSECDFEESITKEERDGKIFLTVKNDDKLIGKTFTLNAADAESNYTPDSVILTVVGQIDT